MFDYKKTVNGLIEEAICKGEINGASFLVLHKGREAFFNAYGYGDKEAGRLMSRDTIIRLFSMTKPITAAAVMILAERGEIDLLHPVSRYLPYFQGQKVLSETGEPVPVHRDSTIWDMLNMTSGIPYPDAAHEPGRQMDKLFRELIGKREQGERVDTQEYLKRIADIPLCFQPGDRWMYGLSADVLGGVVEAVCGRSFGEFLKEELFEPLKMQDTGFYVPEEKRGRFAQIYEWSEEEGKLKIFSHSHLGEYYGEDVAFESGGAGLVSTIDDYSRFATMMLQGGEYEGRRILGRKTVEFMAQNRLSREQRREYVWESTLGYGYGCLMRVLMDQGAAGTNASLGEYGWDGWTGNYVTIDPAEDLIILYFIQRCGAGFTPLVRKLRMATYGALESL